MNHNKALIQAYARGMNEALQPSLVQWPFFFMSTYKQCGLNEQEAMVALQLFAFRQSGNLFPLVEEISARMSYKADQILHALQRMMKIGYLTIDEKIDAKTGVHFETYNLQPLMERVFELYAERNYSVASGQDQPIKKQPMAVQLEKSIFQMFEEEFGRLLSPLECETISKWLDEDKYPQDLIRYALREAVFAGKLHFRYIDRILFDWQQNKVRTAEEAKQHAAKFRGLK